MKMDQGWRCRDMPALEGRCAVVTGTGGLGYEAALALAGAGADVVLAGRSKEKGLASVGRIRDRFPGAKIRFAELDLCSLVSVRTFCGRFVADHDRLDILINNAGIMSIPRRRVSEDGFEVQLATNYLGHYALTGGLLSQLCAAAHPRVVNVSSLAHRSGRIRFEDPQWTRTYKAWGAYSQSKLALLMFSLELQRRSDANGWGIRCSAAHPGFARTELGANSSDGLGKKPLERIFDTMAPFISHSAADGTLPILCAATDPEAVNGGYYGPAGFLELKGRVATARIATHARSESTATRLWELSQDLTGRPFPG